MRSIDFETSGMDTTMPTRRRKIESYAICMRNTGFAASLEVRKLYPVLADAGADANDPVRVIDESGEN